MKTNTRKGISLITLVITIVVIILLVGAIVISISNNNPISQASDSVLRSDISNMADSYNLIYASELRKANGIKENIDITAFKGVIPEKYSQDFTATNEGIEYNCRDNRISEIVTDISQTNPILILNCTHLTIPVIKNLEITSGSDTINIKIKYNNSISGVTDFIYYISTDNITWTEYSEKLDRKTISGLKKDTEYKVKVKIIDTEHHEVESEVSTVRTKVVEIPVIDPIDTNWSNQNKIVTIRYPETGVIKKQYSFDGNTWIDSTTSNNIEELSLDNNITVYARCLDISNNESGVATSQVTKIDKIPPTISGITTSDISSSNITVNISANDTGGSNIAKYGYSKDNGATYIESTLSSYSFTGLTASTTYPISIYVLDNAGNVSITYTDNIATAAARVEIEGVVIPTGFYYVGGTKNTGIVISDNAADKDKGDSYIAAKYLVGNQYVWVPVASEADFIRREWNNGNSVESHIEPYESGYSTEGSEYNEMKSKVIANQGFYIARYEASNNNGKAESKALKMPWTNIYWGRSNYELSPGSAPYVGRQTSNDLRYTSVQSTLIYGVEWDNALKFIEDTGISVTDSTSWGNYTNAAFSYTKENNVTSTKPINTSTLIPTGATERHMKQNISDMAGNVQEWIMEFNTSTYGRGIRGGTYYNSGNSTPAAIRSSGSPYSNCNEYLGFRVALYIK